MGELLGEELTTAEKGAAAAEGASAADEGAAKLSTLQSGGNTISNQTAQALNKNTGMNLPKRAWGHALESLKKEEGLSNSTDGKIMSNGDYIVNGDVVSNLTHYTH